MASSSTTSPSPAQEQQQEDRLGALPDSILLLILSFLPTVDVVRTSVLATRWRTLWTSIGALDLDEAYNGDFFFGIGGTKIGKRWSKSGFVEFVGKVLSFHHTSTLHRLRLSYCSQNCPLQDWVCTAVSRRIQSLDLRLPWTAARRLPSLLFASQSLVELRLDLSGSALVLPGTMALVGLRRMRLCRVRFCDDHSTRALFSSSTALRSLALENCDYRKLGCLDILCSSLQELAIEDTSPHLTSFEEDDDMVGPIFTWQSSPGNQVGLDGCQVKIAAPHLTSFVYVAPAAQVYVVEPVVCVEYVKIQFRSFAARKSILDRTRNICRVCFEALTPSRRTSELLYQFRNLNVLRMEVKYLDYGAVLVVLRLLLLNPQLRALVVEVKNLCVSPSSYRKKDDFLKLEDVWNFESRNGVVERVEIRCRDSNLYIMKVIRCTTEPVLELVRLLLGTQPRLEKLVLANHLFWDRDPTISRRDAIMEKVLSFPRLTHGLAVAFI